MISQVRWAATLALAAAATGCRTAGPPPAIADDVAACVPAGAVLLAGARLDALRASPIYPRLPASAQTFLKPFENASSLLLVFNGAEILLIAQGHFREAAPGATLAGPSLMLSGSPALIQSALAARRSHAAKSSDLLTQASAAANGHALWIVTRGGVNLPLSGDAANINRFLRLANFAAVGLHIEPPLQLDLMAQCPTPEAARHLEETLRAFFSLLAATLARQPDLAALLRAAEVSSEANTVHGSMAVPADTMPRLLELFTR
jgi:hypothetical protein